MAKKKDTKQLLRTLREQGCECELTRGQHWRVRLPNGDQVILAGSGGDGRGLQNAKALLRRKGIEL